LVEQAVPRFAKSADMERYHVTIEARKEHEPHVQAFFVVYFGYP